MAEHELPVEAPDPDTIEQFTTLDDRELLDEPPPSIPVEADEADVVEQTLDVPVDDDDYLRG